MFSQDRAGEAKELPVVVKGDVQGSVEAIRRRSMKLGTDAVRVRVLHAAVGAINESDITLAKASNALIIGFNVRANPQARDMARRDGVEIRYYSIIYDVVDDMKTGAHRHAGADAEASASSATPQIREVFNITKVGKVAGCMVTEGAGQARRQGAPAARQRGDPRRRAQPAQALQGRCPRGARGLRVRHVVRELQRHPEGRHDRVLRDRGSRRAPCDGDRSAPLPREGSEGCEEHR